MWGVKSIDKLSYLVALFVSGILQSTVAAGLLVSVYNLTLTEYLALRIDLTESVHINWFSKRTPTVESLMYVCICGLFYDILSVPPDSVEPLRDTSCSSTLHCHNYCPVHHPCFHIGRSYQYPLCDGSPRCRWLWTMLMLLSSASLLADNAWAADPVDWPAWHNNNLFIIITL